MIILGIICVVSLILQNWYIFTISALILIICIANKWLTNDEEKRSKEEEENKKFLDKIKVYEELKNSKKIIVDCETTGLEKRDEILQLSILDGDGKVLFDEKFKPIHKKEWQEAEEVNGISPDDVKDKKHIEDYLDVIQDIIDHCNLIVGYNIDFDIGYLERAGLICISKRKYDVMKEFAVIYGDYDEKHDDYVYQKLTKCARYYGYKFNAHNSLEDCKATLYCFNQIINDKIERVKQYYDIE